MRILIWIAALLPLLYISFRYSLEFDWVRSIARFMHESLHLNPGGHPKHMTRFLLDTTAMTALNLFIITLALRPLRDYLKINMLGYKRLLGLFGFFYLLLHVTVFIGLKHHWELHDAVFAITHHLFLVFGVLAFLIMLMMTITSLPFLYKKLHSWHKLYYLAMVFVMVHFLLAQKSISFEYIVYTAIISALLALRLLKR